MKKQPITRVGYITPTSWDARQNIRGISLLTTDHQEIRIAHTKKGDRLLSLVWEKVELTGYLENERGGRRRMIVTNYQSSDFDNLSGDTPTEEGVDIENELRDMFGTHYASTEFDRTELPRGL